MVESLAFANALSAFRNAGARLLAARVDDEGLDVAEAERVIERTGARPRAFFVVPNFQNPRGTRSPCAAASGCSRSPRDTAPS